MALFQQAKAYSSGRRRNLVFVLFVMLVLSCALLLQTQKGWEHYLAGLPHWSTRCPSGAPAFLVLGQSQASNTGPIRNISFSRSRAFAQDACYYLRDPMPGTAGRGGTIWPKLADNLAQPVVIADIAVSGSAIEEWITDTQMKKTRDTLHQLRKAGYPNPIIIWMQGETNGARKTSADDYYGSLRRLMTLAPNNHWIITKESVCYGLQTRWKPLDAARKRLALTYGNVTLGPDLDTIPLSFRQPDRCHLSVEGQARLAAEMAVAVRPFLEGN